MCETIHCPHPDLLEDYLTTKQYIDWELYYKSVGFGSDRNDVYWTQLLALTANIHRAKNTQPTKPIEWNPWYDPFRQELTADDLAERLGL